ncbi:hypothetical protein HanRHA438_Chr08g0342761 [Helianthus annuus]|nr:hypothetical protein HanRHA438_Chr08g0342761 [Helianthus annuus]
MKHAKIFEREFFAQSLNKVIEEMGIISRKNYVIHIDHEITSDVLMLVDKKRSID